MAPQLDKSHDWLDKLQGWFDLIYRATYLLDLLEGGDEETAALVKQAFEEIADIEAEIRPIDGVESPNVDCGLNYDGAYQAAREVEIIASGLAKIFAPHADLSVFRALVDKFDTKPAPEEYRTLEELNRFDEDD